MHAPDVPKEPLGIARLVRGRRLLARLAPVVVLALSGCAGATSTSLTSPSTPRPTIAEQPAGTAGTLHLSGGEDFAFHPAVLHARPGRISIDFVGVGDDPHNLEFPTLHKASSPTSHGHGVVLNLGVVPAGSYPFICDYHQSGGMRGVLVVATTAG
jgi:plastocyanin